MLKLLVELKVTVLELATIPFVTVTTESTVPGAVQIPSAYRLYVTVPPAILVAPVNVAESVTDPPTVIVVAERLVVTVTTVGLTVIVLDVPELPAWTESVGLYVPVTVAVPAVNPVKVTEQLPAADKVHWFVPVMLPEPVATAKSTVPAGVLAPALAVSATVAVQVEPWPATTGLVQLTPVEVERALGVTAVDVPELPAWAESFGVYVPLTVKLAVVDGVKVTVQVPVADSVQGEPETAPVPVARATSTEPAGVEAPAPAVSTTVTVQVETWPTITALHETLVEVERAVGTTAVDVPELVAWPGEGDVSPLYMPLIVKLAVVDGVKVTEQDATAPVPDRVHEEPVLPVKLPVPDEIVKLTAPVGVVGAAAISVTVAVQVEPWPTVTRDVHETPVVVGSGGCVTILIVPEVPELVAWAESDGVYMPVTVAVPRADPVKVTEQVPAERVHGEPVMLPVLVPGITTKLTVPAGVVAPVPAVSATTALQVMPTLTVAEAGQATVVEVVRRFTVIVLDVPELVVWLGGGDVSPLYLPVTVAVPIAEPVKVEEQLAVPVTPAIRVQLAVAGVTLPVAVKLTLPVGVVGVVEVSVTVAVQVEPWFTNTVTGAQETEVEVKCSLEKLAIDPLPRFSGTAPLVPPLVMVTQTPGTLVPVQEALPAAVAVPFTT
jgi:hypothetical protein